MERLFIYGTLAPGKPNEHILKDIEGTWEKASVNGILKEQGWGSDLGYPGIVLDNNCHNIVEGLIFESNQLKDKFKQLDEFEGNEYKRILTKVTLDTGEVIDAFIYALNEKVN